jgi:AraC family transcriptional regulator of adaptative response / DNA-3-methyladenine glycosylase II
VVIESFDRCYRAVKSKDPRFDGWFFTAVTSTGVYCRPSCPAMTPKVANVRFFATSAAAQQAGFRACKRCRPDAAPGSPEWDTRADLVARAMRLIADGVVDREGVPGLAARLGYGTRQVERILVAGVGAGPLALARAQRAQAARLLIETTGVPMAQVAFAAGFSSVRQFNETVKVVFGTSPNELRRLAGHGPAGRAAAPAAPAPAPGQTVVLRLPFRAPFCPDNLFGHLAATAVPGVEETRDGAYRRTLSLAHGTGLVSLRPAAGHVWASISLADLRDLAPAIARCRRLLDLDADPSAVDELLCADPALAPLVRAAPGRRVPRTVDEAEMAVRAVLGQQVSTKAARTHAGRLASALGTPVTDERGGLSRTFPGPAALSEALLAARYQVVPGRTPRAGLLAGPLARQEALSGLVAAMAGGSLDLGPGSDWLQARAKLSELAGIGPWTVEVIAMRALGDPDAFPSSDLGLRRGAALAQLPASATRLAARAQAWRPWRAYATQYLWATLDHPINRFPLAGGDDKERGAA